MSTYMGVSRRADGDRRTFDTKPKSNRRRIGVDRRRNDTDRFFFVIGNGGIDQFGLLVSLPLAFLILFLLISMAVHR